MKNSVFLLYIFFILLGFGIFTYDGFFIAQKFAASAFLVLFVAVCLWVDEQITLEVNNHGVKK